MLWPEVPKVLQCYTGQSGVKVCLIRIFELSYTIELFRFINKDGKKFLEEFQPEIAKKTGAILKDYLNKFVHLKNIIS